MPCDKPCDRRQDAGIDFFLRFLSLRHDERVITAGHDVTFIRRAHVGPDAAEQIKRAERVAGSLHEKNRCGHFAQDFVAELRGVAAAAERIAKADDCTDLLLKREMAADPPAHALPDENERPLV